jgi:hypothetical protein
MKKTYHFNTTLDYYIGIDENETTEFKNYTLPLDNERIFALQKTVSAFLNTKGGTIFIGVNNFGIIKGAWLNKEEYNDIQAYFIDLFRDIEPGCKGFITIDIINLEIKQKNTKEKLPHLIMLKVDKGNDHYVYNVSKYSGAYIRVAASNAYIDKSSYEDRIINNFLKTNPLLKTVYELSNTEDSCLLMHHIANFKSQKISTKEETFQVNSELSIRADSNDIVQENESDLCICMQRKKKKGGLLCYKCYRKNSEKKASKCSHPDRTIYANGQCKSCYDSKLLKK